METVLNWLQAHWVEILAIVGALYAAARGIVGLTPTPADDRYLEKSSGWLKAIAKLAGLTLAQGVRKMIVIGACAALLTGCITTTVTAPDGTVTETQQIDLNALAQLPGIIGALGDELARIEDALDDVDENAPPTADEIAMRARRQAILDRLLELGIEVITESDDPNA